MKEKRNLSRSVRSLSVRSSTRLASIGLLSEWLIMNLIRSMPWKRREKRATTRWQPSEKRKNSRTSRSRRFAWRLLTWDDNRNSQANWKKMIYWENFKTILTSCRRPKRNRMSGSTPSDKRKWIWRRRTPNSRTTCRSKETRSFKWETLLLTQSKRQRTSNRNGRTFKLQWINWVKTTPSRRARSTRRSKSLWISKMKTRESRTSSRNRSKSSRLRKKRSALRTICMTSLKNSLTEMRLPRPMKRINWKRKRSS